MRTTVMSVNSNKNEEHTGKQPVSFASFLKLLHLTKFTCFNPSQCLPHWHQWLDAPRFQQPEHFPQVALFPCLFAIYTTLQAHSLCLFWPLTYRYARSCCGCPVPCLTHAIYTKKFWSACRQFHAYSASNLLAQKWLHNCMGWWKSEPMGRSKAYHSQCKHSHSVKQILDLTFCIQEWIPT